MSDLVEARNGGSAATSALQEVQAYLDEIATTDRGPTWERASHAVRGLEGVVRGEMAVTRLCKDCYSRFTLTAEEVLFFTGKVRPDGTKWQLPRRCARCRESRGLRWTNGGHPVGGATVNAGRPP